jgi:hypothetical protein
MTPEKVEVYRQRLANLSDRVVSDLRAAHDYHAHTVAVWRMVLELAGEGRTIDVSNFVTGTTVGAGELADLGPVYVQTYLAESVFQHCVTLFEDFVFGLIGIWLSAYPKGLGRGDSRDRSERTIPLKIVLDAPDRDAIIRTVVDRELDRLKYERIDAWFAYLHDRVKLELPTSEQIRQLAEIKASRDLLVHNRGIVNATYLDKAGILARYRDGDQIEIREAYLTESWSLISQVVTDLATGAMGKLK